MKNVNEGMIKVNLDHDEADAFLKDLSSKASFPTDKFRKDLKAKVMAENKKEKTDFGFSFFKRYKLAGVLSVVLILLVGGSIGMYRALFNTTKKSLMNDSRASILASIAANNPSGLLATRNTANLPNLQYRQESASSSLTEDMSAMNETFVNSLRAPDNQSYVYARQTVESGPAFTRCYSTQNTTSSKSISDSYSFYQKDKEGQSVSYYKTITTNDEGDILDYSLTKDSGNSIIYLGGKYAVELVYLQRASQGREPEVATSDEKMVVEKGLGDEEDTAGVPLMDSVERPDSDVGEELSVTDDLSLIFGENAQFEENATLEGKTYYKVTYNDYNLCLEENLLKGDEQTSVARVVVYIDPETFEIKRQDVYVESIAPKNLVETSTYSFEMRNAEFDEVSDIFTSDDLDVEIREVKVEDYNYQEYEEEYRQNMYAYLDTSNYSQLLPTNNAKTVASFDIYDALPTDETYSFYKDRDFYPDGELGDKIYENYNSNDDDWIDPDISYSFYKDEPAGASEGSLYVSMYDKTNVNLQDVLEMQEKRGYVIRQSSSKIPIIIDVENVTGTVLEVSRAQKYNKYDDEESQYLEPSFAQVIFEYKGYIYSVNIQLEPSESLESILKFRSLDTSIVSERNKFKQILETMFEKIDSEMPTLRGQ